MINIIVESNINNGWNDFYQDGVGTVHSFIGDNGQELGGYYEDSKYADTFHAYLRSGKYSGDARDFSNAYDAIEWVETLGETNFEDEVYEDVPGGRYWEPGWDDYEEEEPEEFDHNYDDNDPPFESKKVTEGSASRIMKNGKSVTNLTIGDLRKMDLWDEDRIVIVDDNGDAKDVSKIYVDEDNGYLYIS